MSPDPFGIGEAIRTSYVCKWLEDLMRMFNSSPDEVGPPKTWQEIATELWILLDDVDTAGDTFKPEWGGFEEYVTRKANERWKYASSDGHTLTFNTNESSGE